MAEFPALPVWTDAYLADCHHLDDAEHGRYFLLLMLMWRSPQCRIPNDDEWIAKRLHRDADAVRTHIRPLVREFCETDGEWLVQRRLQKEWRWLQEKRKKNSQSAKARWDKEKDTSEGISERISVRNAPTPTPKPTPTSTKEYTVANATVDQQFEEFWKAYPKRDGSNPKQPARKIFAAALKSGHQAEKITAGAERYTAFMQSKGSVGTAYVAQAQTWLRQARWDDELPTAAAATNGHAPVSRERLEGVWRGYLEKEKAFGYWPSLNNPKHEIPREFIAKWEAEQTATAGAK